MGRLLKRVPLDFDWPLREPWEGYTPSIETFKKLFGDELPWIMECQCLLDICADKCPGRKNDECVEAAAYCVWHNPRNKQKWYQDVPEGAGYQAWQDTSDPSPISPVFATLDELCTWCAENETIFAYEKTTAEEWKSVLTGEGYVVFSNGSDKNIFVI